MWIWFTNVSKFIQLITYSKYGNFLINPIIIMLILSSLTTHHWRIQLILDALGILFSHSIVYGFENPTLYPPCHQKREISTISKYSQYGYQSSSFSEYNSTVIFLRPNSQAWDRMDPFEQSLCGNGEYFPGKCSNHPDIESLHYKFDTDNLLVQTRIFTRRFIPNKAVHGKFTILPFASINELEGNQRSALPFHSILLIPEDDNMNERNL